MKLPSFSKNLYPICLWGPCGEKSILVQRNLLLLCETFYLVDADVFWVVFFFCWSLAPHPLPLACQGDSRDWTHSKGSQQSPLLCWTFRELGSTAGSMHQKISNFSSLLWPVFHTDYGYQHFQHPHVSVCQSDICLSTTSVSKDSIEWRLRR